MRAERRAERRGEPRGPMGGGRHGPTRRTAGQAEGPLSPTGPEDGTWPGYEGRQSPARRSHFRLRRPLDERRKATEDRPSVYSGIECKNLWTVSASRAAMKRNPVRELPGPLNKTGN